MKFPYIDKNVFIIAEIGLNHNGNIEIAEKMIEKASECGADAVKLQLFSTEDFIDKNSALEMFNFFKTVELKEENIKRLVKCAEDNNIIIFATPFDVKSIKIVENYNFPLIKIASGDIRSNIILKNISLLKKPVIISTGAAKIEEISDCLSYFNNIAKAILHCISSYPPEDSEINLATIPFLKDQFKLPVGFSDHSIGITASISAVSLGARIIEKHFTLDKNMEGPDQKLSIDPKQLSDMISKIRRCEKMRGSYNKIIALSENNARKNASRSCFAFKDINKGEEIKYNMIIEKRPSAVSLPSKDVLSKKARRKIFKNEPILKDMIM